MSDRTLVEWFSARGDRVTFTTGPAATNRLIALTGIGPMDAEPQAIKSPGQSGTTGVDASVGSRVVGIQAILQAPSSDGLWTLRAALARACAQQPLHINETLRLGVLRVTLIGRAPLELECMVSSADLQRPRGTSVFSGADIELYAPYPYWREIGDTHFVFNDETDGGFEFPVEFPLEIITNNVENEIDNQGDVDAPILARFYGEADTVRIINLTTGETIEVTGPIESDEYIEVDTTFGHKTLLLVNTTSGAVTSVMDRLNLDLARFWSLRPGLNQIRFEADTNTSGHAEIFWRQRYSGI